jgi:hypothetical protein
LKIRVSVVRFRLWPPRIFAREARKIGQAAMPDRQSAWQQCLVGNIGQTAMPDRQIAQAALPGLQDLSIEMPGRRSGIFVSAALPCPAASASDSAGTPFFFVRQPVASSDVWDWPSHSFEASPCL